MGGSPWNRSSAAAARGPEDRHIPGPGDYELARDEHDADGELVLRQVEEVFERTAYRLQIITLRSSTGIVQTIQTTAEHPVYALPQGWDGPKRWTTKLTHLVNSNY
jgi:hypothetical protein